MSRIRIHTYLRRRLKEPELATAIYDPTTEQIVTASGESKPIIVRNKSLAAGISRPDLIDDEWDFAHPMRKIPSRSIRETSASTLDDLLEFGVVPPTYLREYKEWDGPEGEEKGPDDSRWITKVVSLQTGIEGRDFGYKDRVVPGRLDPEISDRALTDMVKITILDFILGQTDRSYGNMMIDKRGRIWAIDNDAILGVFPKGLWGGKDSLAYQYVQGRGVPETVRKSLKDLAYEDFVTALAGNPWDEVNKAWERKKVAETWDSIPDAKTFDFYSTTEP